MSQFSIFFVPVKGDERSEEALNRCLRTRRVLQVERHVFPDGWTFCVEWLDDKPGLCRVRDAVGDYLVDELGLCLKDSSYINRTAHGMDFLGFSIRPDGLRAAREGLRRYKRKMRMCGMLLREGVLSESAYQDRITALTASLLPARTHGWRCAHFRDLARSVGREPRETGRELEQRGGQLPSGVSQQQRADEPQQQQRLPRPLLRSVAI